MSFTSSSSSSSSFSFVCCYGKMFGSGWPFWWIKTIKLQRQGGESLSLPPSLPSSLPSYFPHAAFPVAGLGGEGGGGEGGRGEEGGASSLFLMVVVQVVMLSWLPLMELWTEV